LSSPAWQGKWDVCVCMFTSLCECTCACVCACVCVHKPHERILLMSSQMYRSGRNGAVLVDPARAAAQQKEWLTGMVDSKRNG